MRPLVSIITPYYNSGQRIQECAESVYAQTCDNWEWIIVSDGSDEKNREALMSVKRAKLSFISERRSPSACRNDAASMARGDYIVALDADNVLEPNALEKWLSVVSSKEKVFAYSWLTIFGPNQPRPWVRRIPKFDVESLLWHGNYIDTCAMYRRSDFERCGGYDPHVWFMEDLDLWLNFASHGITGEVIEEPLFRYRARGDSLVNKWTQAEKVDGYDGIRMKYAGLVSKHPMKRQPVLAPAFLAKQEPRTAKPWPFSRVAR